MQDIPGHDRVRLSRAPQYRAASWIRGIVAAVAAGAGSLAAVSIGDNGIEPQQYWAAIAAAAAALGGVLGVSEQSTETYAPRGELDKMAKREPPTLKHRRDRVHGHDQESAS